jgi:hypothetical protein
VSNSFLGRKGETDRKENQNDRIRLNKKEGVERESSGATNVLWAGPRLINS